MAISVFDMYKVGIGPSSSHTVGPMRAALTFVRGLAQDGLLLRVARIRAELYGSLGATGKGHGSDKAVLLGLEGEAPDQVDPDAIEGRLARIRGDGQVRLLGERPIPFDEKTDLVFLRRQSLPFHPNGLKMIAFAENGAELAAKTYYSVGGGFVVDEEAAGANRIVPDATPLPYPYHSGAELLALCAAHGFSISQLMLENEKAWRSEDEIRRGLLHIWQVMQECVRRGCEQEGVLPGGMKVQRLLP
ncbi:MAG: serine dehydratase beta chain, partial [Actinomycetota bacterium]